MSTSFFPSKSSKSLHKNVLFIGSIQNSFEDALKKSTSSVSEMTFYRNYPFETEFMSKKEYIFLIYKSVMSASLTYFPSENTVHSATLNSVANIVNG